MGGSQLRSPSYYQSVASTLCHLCLVLPPGFRWPWPSWRRWGTWSVLPPPYSPTWSQSTPHTTLWTQSGRSGRSHSCASEAAHSPGWSCTHSPCSFCQTAACPPRQRWRQWWPAPGSDYPELPRSYQWSWSTCWGWARIWLVWRLSTTRETGNRIIEQLFISEHLTRSGSIWLV